MSQSGRRTDMLERINELMRYTNCDKQQFCELTGYSADQYYSWFAPSSSARARTPTVIQLQQVTLALNWSPTYVLHGLGARTLSEISSELSGWKSKDAATVHRSTTDTILDVVLANNKRGREVIKKSLERIEATLSEITERLPPVE
jgi:hypothetical protein